MATDHKHAAHPPPDHSHRLARLLRHEVGDLLQSVYSTVAILQERLPPELALERRLVNDLKARAEVCRGELDAVVDLASDLLVTPGRVDLGGVIGSILIQVRRRFPTLQIHFVPGETTFAGAEPRLLSSALWLLSVAICQAAQSRVQVGIYRDGPTVECRIERDGPGVSDEQLAWLRQPFATTQHVLFGLGLALVQRAVTPAGGAVQASNRDAGGIGVHIRFPVLMDV
jgi:signal transduction histidine kinase